MSEIVSAVLMLGRAAMRVKQLIDQHKSNLKYAADMTRRVDHIGHVLGILQDLPADTLRDLKPITDGVEGVLRDLETAIAVATEKKSRLAKLLNIKNADGLKAKLEAADERLSRYLHVLNAAQGAKQLQQTSRIEAQMAQLAALSQQLFALSLLPGSSGPEAAPSPLPAPVRTSTPAPHRSVSRTAPSPAAAASGGYGYDMEGAAAPRHPDLLSAAASSAAVVASPSASLAPLTPGAPAAGPSTGTGVGMGMGGGTGPNSARTGPRRAAGGRPSIAGSVSSSQSPLPAFGGAGGAGAGTVSTSASTAMSMSMSTSAAGASGFGFSAGPSSSNLATPLLAEASDVALAGPHYKMSSAGAGAGAMPHGRDRGFSSDSDVSVLGAGPAGGGDGRTGVAFDASADKASAAEQSLQSLRQLARPQLYAQSHALARYVEVAAHQFICGSFIGALALTADGEARRVAIAMAVPVSPIVTAVVFAWRAGRVKAVFAGGVPAFLSAAWLIYRLYATPVIFAVCVLAFLGAIERLDTLDVYSQFLWGLAGGIALYALATALTECGARAQARARAEAAAAIEAHMAAPAASSYAGEE